MVRIELFKGEETSNKIQVSNAVAVVKLFICPLVQISASFPSLAYLLFYDKFVLSSLVFCETPPSEKRISVNHKLLNL